MDEDELIGEPIENVPQKDPDYQCNARKSEKREEGPNLFRGYCKNRAGKGTDHVGEGRCDRHGGASPRGEDHPSFKHGLFSDHLSDEDREAMAAIEGTSNPEALQSMINYELLRLRRAVAYLEGEEDDSRTFFDAFERVLDEATASGGLEPADIGQLAKLLDSGSEALLRRMDQIRKMMRTYQELTDGQKISLDGDLSHTHAGDPEAPPVSIEWKRSSLEEDYDGDE